MRMVALFLALVLAGCSKPAWHMTDISGAMPRLDFRLSTGGKPVTAQAFRGKVVALYFGYTHCPDVCPTTLANLADMLGKVKSPDVTVLFVTVDPERDTDAVMADYAKVVVVFFGYTQCPDVCPTSMAELAEVKKLLGKDGDRLQGIFVTVDPERDTDAVMADYAKAFSPQVVGLRGSDNALAALARQYRVAYSVKKGPPYEVMHSNAVFFFDKDGKARLVTTDTSNTAAMADDVKRLLD